MSYHDPEHGPKTAEERWAVAIFLGVVLTLLFAAVFQNFEPVRISAVLVLAFWAPLLILHEVGHAVTAALLGWRVRRVVIGMGPVLGRFLAGNTLVEFRLVPVEGFVEPLPVNMNLLRIKSAIIYFAGPGVELLLVGVLFAIFGSNTLLSRCDDYGVIAVQSLALAAGLGVFINLVPHAVRTPQGWIANDGLGILLSLFSPDFTRRYENPHEESEPDREAYDR